MKKKKITLIILMCCLAACHSAKKVTAPAKETPKAAATQSKETDHNITPNNQRDRMVLITTDFGNMKVKLYNATPKHRDNFIKLVQQGFYDSLLFHRVIRNFMIQGGDPQSKTAAPGVMLGNGDIGYTIPAEFVDSLFTGREPCVQPVRKIRRRPPAVASSTLYRDRYSPTNN